MTNEMASLDLVKKCHFAIAKAVTVGPNPTSRSPSYILALQLSAALSTEHQALFKKAKPTYTSSAQITSQHSVAELKDALMLTLINFPRKQIGRTMSDCLTTGVSPWGDEVSEEVKKKTIIYVRPFLGKGPTKEKAAMLEPGSKVGVLGEEGVFETNPRDLSWDEFMKMRFLVGKVLSVGTAPQPESESDKADSSQAIPIPVKLDFGVADGHKDALVYLRPGFITPDELIGRQVLAVVDVELPTSTVSAEGDDEKKSGTLVLTVGGKTVLEPAKEAENGFRLG